MVGSARKCTASPGWVIAQKGLQCFLARAAPAAVAVFALDRLVLTAAGAAWAGSFFAAASAGVLRGGACLAAALAGATERGNAARALRLATVRAAAGVAAALVVSLRT